MRGCTQQEKGFAERAGVVLAVLAGVLAVWPASAAGQIDADEVAFSYTFLDLSDPCAVRDEQDFPMLTFARFDANDTLVWAEGFESIEAWCTYARSDLDLAGTKTQQAGWMLCHDDEEVFWPLQALLYLCPPVRSTVAAIESRTVVYDVFARVWVAPGIELTDGDNSCYQPTATVSWNPTITSVFGRAKLWHSFPPLVGLAHELVHAQQRVVEDKYIYASPLQIDAMKGENVARHAFYTKVPGNENLRPRPGNGGYYLDAQFRYPFDDIDWEDWSPDFSPLLDVFEEN